jgi:AraC-like DNA-binding protein
MLKHIEHYIEVNDFFYQKDEIVAPHSSLWGDFNFSLNGILKSEIEGQRYLSPPNYGLWLPPQTAHASIALDEQITHYVCIRVHPCLCEHFAACTKTLSIRPFLRHLVHEILEQKQQGISTLHYRNLLQVLFDQLKTAPAYEHYLPQTHHVLLQPLLQQLANPALFQKSLQQLLRDSSISERHLLRLSQQELQLSLSEWRNRAKILYAITQIRQGKTVKKLAYELGYQHSSSFIEFFKRYTEQTPAQLRDI